MKTLIHYFFPQKRLEETIRETLKNPQYLDTFTLKELQKVMSYYRRLHTGHEEELSHIPESDLKNFELSTVKFLTLKTGIIDPDYTMYEHYFPLLKWLANGHPELLMANVEVIEQKILLLPSMYSMEELSNESLELFFREAFLHTHWYHNTYYQEAIIFDRPHSEASALLFMEQVVTHAMPYVENALRSSDPLFISVDESETLSLREKIGHLRKMWKESKHPHSLLGLIQREVAAIQQWPHLQSNDDIQSMIQFLQCDDCDLNHNAFYQKLEDALSTPSMEI